MAKDDGRNLCKGFELLLFDFKLLLSDNFGFFSSVTSSFDGFSVYAPGLLMWVKFCRCMIFGCMLSGVGCVARLLNISPMAAVLVAIFLHSCTYSLDQTSNQTIFVA